MSDTVISVEISENPDKRLDKALARDVPVEANLSRSRLAKLLAEGAVSRNGVVVTDQKAKVAEGEVYEIRVAEAVDLEASPENIPLDVVYDDDALIVVNKPAGMVVHPAPGSPSGTLVNALLHHSADSLSGIGGAKRPGIVHRIDKDTSGLLVVAKSDAAHQGLAKQFEKHSVERHYRALCYGRPDAADPRLRGMPGVDFEASNLLRVNANLARHKTDRQRQAVVKNAGRHAITRARVVDSYGTPPTVSLLDCWLETGRTHQIRVHMAYCGHSLIGDPVYGGKRKLAKKSLPDAAIAAIGGFPRQALHAATLGFIHPVSGEKLSFEAPLPQDFAELITELSR
ncbi:RluA family pseudouridine synthase [uncultured Litoreibacter sp.]|uniref:RluA family pseudouridine synthase n=1 Tax=uncultured Litoreibacter sp. TaxID=1392394 RepID=UPI00260B935A|nr:RluA family pseudouridine synthase [uncultured Litoreibacter sp.]